MHGRLGPIDTRKGLFLALTISVQVGSAALAWRDLNRRTDRQVRGNKRVWRAAVAIHPGNSLTYWLLGRR